MAELMQESSPLRDGAGASDALLEAAAALRRLDQTVWSAAYSELLYSFASCASGSAIRRFVGRLQKVAKANPRWREPLSQLTLELASDPSVKLRALQTYIEQTTEADDFAALAALKSGFRLSRRLSYTKTNIEFSVSSEHELGQIEKFRTREVETQEWIEGFAAGSVFYDVGANIGLFSLLAACQPGKNLQVVAFEPTFASFHSLCQNLWLNNVSEQAIPLQCGLSDTTGVDRLNLKRLEPGTAKSVVGDAIDFRNQPFRPLAVFHVPVLRLDDAIKIYRLPMPDHIKVDVDGIEMKVLAGARETMANPALQSIMVEAASVEMEHELALLMARFGFELFRKANKQLGALEDGHTRNNYFHRPSNRRDVAR